MGIGLVYLGEEEWEIRRVRMQEDRMRLEMDR